MRRSLEITVISVLLAFSVIFNFVPISFGPVNIALLLIPIIIAAQTGSFRITLVVSAMTGVLSCIAFWTVKAGGLLAPVFQNPLISVVPRIFVGVVAYFVFNGLKALDKKRLAKKNIEDTKRIIVVKSTVISGVSAAFATVTNTALVLFFMYILYNGKTLSNGTAVTSDVIAGLITLNFAIEIVVFTVLIPPITNALAHVIKYTTSIKKEKARVDLEKDIDATGN